MLKKRHATWARNLCIMCLIAHFSNPGNVVINAFTETHTTSFTAFLLCHYVVAFKRDHDQWTVAQSTLSYLFKYKSLQPLGSKPKIPKLASTTTHPGSSSPPPFFYLTSA
jgi:hypothetical protein